MAAVRALAQETGRAVSMKDGVDNVYVDGGKRSKRNVMRGVRLT